MALELLDLPLEVLSHITSFLERPADRRRTALVCQKFYALMRQQSKRSNVLSLRSTNPEKPPICVFEGQLFPFHGLQISCYRRRHFERAVDFWFANGRAITRMSAAIIDMRLNHFLNDVLDFFPNLRRLKLWGENVRLALPVALPSIFELDLSDADFSCPVVDNLIKSCPNLRILRISSRLVDFKSDEFPDYLSAWTQLSGQTFFSGISSMDVTTAQIMQQLILAPTEDFFFKRFEISADDHLEVLRAFFMRPRIIEKLELHESNCITKEKFESIHAEVSELELYDGLPEFEGAMEAIARLKGLKNIFIAGDERFCHLRNTMSPFALQKIHRMFLREEMDETMVEECLRGLSSLQYLQFEFKVNDEMLQVVLRNCPKLGEIRILSSSLTDDGLTGSANEDWRPFSQLTDLRSLTLCARQISYVSFIEAFKFPKLTHLSLREVDLLTVEGVKCLVRNCPSLETIFFSDCGRVDDQCMVVLAEKMRYLRILHFSGCKAKSGSVSKGLREKYPHLKVTFYDEFCH